MEDRPMPVLLCTYSTGLLLGPNLRFGSSKAVRAEAFVPAPTEDKNTLSSHFCICPIYLGFNFDCFCVLLSGNPNIPYLLRKMKTNNWRQRHLCAFVWLGSSSSFLIRGIASQRCFPSRCFVSLFFSMLFYWRTWSRQFIYIPLYGQQTWSRTYWRMKQRFRTRYAPTRKCSTSTKPPEDVVPQRLLHIPSHNLREKNPPHIFLPMNIIHFFGNNKTD